MIVQKELKNNIVLLSEEKANSNAVSIGFWFNVGSRYEKEHEYGTAHFVEHMLFKGTPSRSARDISIEFDRMGGTINAYTERECVCLFCTIPSTEKNILRALDILIDMTHNSIFPEDEFVKERDVIENEILACLDDADEKALNYVSDSIWPDTFMSREITGTVKDVRELTCESLRKFYIKHFINGELSVCVSGNFNFKIIEDRLLELNEHKKIISYPKECHFNETVKWNKGFFNKKSSYNQSQVFVLVPVKPVLSEKEFFVLSILNAVLGDSITSRLFDRLREKCGLCYNVFSYFTSFENFSYWCAFASCDKNHVENLTNRMVEEIKTVLDSCGLKDISDDEFECAKEHVCGEEILSGEDCEYLMKRLEKNFSLGYELVNTESCVEKIRAITKEEVYKIIPEIFNTKLMSVVVYGKKLSKGKIKIDC